MFLTATRHQRPITRSRSSITIAIFLMKKLELNYCNIDMKDLSVFTLIRTNTFSRLRLPMALRHAASRCKSYVRMGRLASQ